MAKNNRPKWDYNMADNPSGDTARTTATPPLAPPATEAGALPEVWTGGTTSAKDSPNVRPQVKAKLWYPQTFTLTAAQVQTVGLQTVPEWWIVALMSASGTVDAGSVYVYGLASRGGAFVPLTVSIPIYIFPGQNTQISIENKEAVSQTVVVIGVSGYEPKVGGF